MPIYTMRCGSCGHTWDRKAKAGDTTCLCAKCGKAIAHSVICAPTLSPHRSTSGKGRN